MFSDSVGIGKVGLELKMYTHIITYIFSVDAAYNIGTMYETGCEDVRGIVVEKNPDMAVRWYTDSAEKVKLDKTIHDQMTQSNQIKL
jgi:hypothetical protein